MKKLYTGEVKKMTVKKLDIFPETDNKLAFNSVVVKKDALFYINRLGVPISIDHDTKLLTRCEAEYYLRDFVKRFPRSADKISCVYAEPPFSFVRELSDEEFRKLKKEKKEERKILYKMKKGNK